MNHDEVKWICTNCGCSFGGNSYATMVTILTGQVLKAENNGRVIDVEPKFPVETEQLCYTCYQKKYEPEAKLGCVLCGNQAEFRILGTITGNVENKISGECDIEDLEQPEPNGYVEPTYHTITCPKCDAEVDVTTAKEEAEKIISGAHECLSRAKV